MANKKGRPTLDDTQTLKMVAAKLIAKECKTPRSAIVQSLPSVDDRHIRRMQRKWRKECNTYLSLVTQELAQQKTQEEQIVVNRRTVASISRDTSTLFREMNRINEMIASFAGPARRIDEIIERFMEPTRQINQMIENFTESTNQIRNIAEKITFPADQMREFAKTINSPSIRVAEQLSQANKAIRLL